MKLNKPKAAAVAVALSPLSAIAQTATDVFTDVETKGTLIMNWFTNGWFAIAMVTFSLLFVVISFLQGRMEWTRAIAIVIASIVVGQVPKLAAYLVNN